MSEDESLFDLDVPEIIVSGRDATTEAVYEAWRLWATLTIRPDGSTPPAQFRKAYRDCLASGEEHSYLMKLVQGAAYMSPRPRDAADLRRLLMPLTNRGHEATALDLYEDRASHEIIPFPRSVVTRKGTIRTVGSLCGFETSLWREEDYEAAGLLIQRYDNAEIEDLVKRARLDLGRDNIEPSSLLRFALTEKSNKATVPQAKRSSYESGRTEQKQLSDALIHADEMAEKLLMAGEPLEKVLAFHHEAPDGYWKEVDRIADDPSYDDVSYATIYEELESTWSWHPKSRSFHAKA